MSNDPRNVLGSRHAPGSSAIPEHDPRPLPRGDTPNNDDGSGSTAQQRSADLHAAVQAVARRTRIELRRRKLEQLRGYVFPAGSPLTEKYAREIAQLEQEIRDEGENP